MGAKNLSTTYSKYILLCVCVCVCVYRNYWKSKDNPCRLTEWKHPETTLESE